MQKICTSKVRTTFCVDATLDLSENGQINEIIESLFKWLFKVILEVHTNINIAVI
jgi:hypothetical protein